MKRNFVWLALCSALFAVAICAPAEPADTAESTTTSNHERLSGVYYEDEGRDYDPASSPSAFSNFNEKSPNANSDGQMKGRQPNIVLIVADDLGSNDVGFNGSPDIRTPNLDALAAEGVKLGNYYVQPVCTPSRVQLLTGVHEVAAGLCHEVIHSAQRNGIPLNIPTIANRLREQGYATHMIGKWNVGHYEFGFMPTHRGFDTFFGFVQALTDHYQHVAFERFKSAAQVGTPAFTTFNGHDFFDGDIPTYAYEGQHLTNLFTSRFENVLKDHISGPRSKKPFFFDISFSAPHWPLEAAQKYIDQNQHIADVNRREYAAMISHLDEAVGNITRALKSNNNIWQNTIVIFTNDNGGTDKFGGNNFPYRGMKGGFFEGGSRGVGFAVSPWIHQKYRGTTTNAWMHISDWYPTFIALAGGSTEGEKLNGFNVWSSLNGDLPSARTELLHGIDVVIPSNGAARPGSPFDVRTAAAIRVGDWKLVTGNPGDGNWYQTPTVIPNVVLQSRAGGFELITGMGQMQPGYVIRANPDPPTKNVWLFNIANDPTETTDLSDQNVDKVNELLQRLAYYQQNVMTACRYPRMDMVANPASFNGNFYPWSYNGLPAPQF